MSYEKQIDVLNYYPHSKAEHKNEDNKDTDNVQNDSNKENSNDEITTENKSEAPGEVPASENKEEVVNGESEVVEKQEEHSQELPIKEEELDRVKEKLEWLEKNLPKIEKVFHISEIYVDKINLAFADVMRNLAYFEERKDRLLAAAKGFKVNFSLKKEDLDDIETKFNEVVEAHQAMMFNQIEDANNFFKKELKKLMAVNDNIIEKVEDNTEVLDTLLRLKKKYVIALAAFGMTFTVLMTVLCMMAFGR